MRFVCARPRLWCDETVFAVMIAHIFVHKESKQSRARCGDEDRFAAKTVCSTSGAHEKNSYPWLGCRYLYISVCMKADMGRDVHTYRFMKW